VRPESIGGPSRTSAGFVVVLNRVGACPLALQLPRRSLRTVAVLRASVRHRRTQRLARIARRCLVRATCQRLVGTSFGCLALTNSQTLWGLPSGSGKGWTPVAAMTRTFMAAVPREQTQPTCRERRSPAWPGTHRRPHAFRQGSCRRRRGRPPRHSRPRGATRIRSSAPAAIRTGAPTRLAGK
jgi:hypothetical protein